MFSKKTVHPIGSNSHMSEWWREASQFQRWVSEHDKTDDTEFSEERARRSVVYTRLDIVLLVSLLDSLNKQVYWIKIAVCLIAGALLWR